MVILSLILQCPPLFPSPSILFISSPCVSALRLLVLRSGSVSHMVDLYLDTVTPGLQELGFFLFLELPDRLRHSCHLRVAIENHVSESNLKLTFFV